MPGPSGKRLARNAQQNRQVEQRRTLLQSLWPKILDGFRLRIGNLVSAIGGSRELDRRSGVPHNTISGWNAGGQPSFESLWRVTYATGRSADWLLGFDVPEMRREGGQERADLFRRTLVRDLVAELNLGPRFVDAALDADEDALRRRLVEHYAPIIQALAHRKRAAEAIERLRDLPRARPGGPRIGQELRKSIRRLDADREADERRAMDRLPSPNE